MGNTAYEIEQRRKARVVRESKKREWASSLADRVITEINRLVIRPGPKPEERECTLVASEIEALQPRITELILEAGQVDGRRTTA